MELLRTRTTGDAGYSSFELCGEVGVTYRILDYWARTGILRPTVRDARGPGSARRYSAADVKVATILNVLRQMGATGEVLAAVAGAMPDADLTAGCLFVSPSGDITTDEAAAHAAWACWWVVSLDAVLRPAASADAAEMAG